MRLRCCSCASTFVFNDTATTEIYTLSLHDALPILASVGSRGDSYDNALAEAVNGLYKAELIGLVQPVRSEEHTSELQSRPHLVCRLLLEKKKKKLNIITLKQKKTPTEIQ